MEESSEQVQEIEAAVQPKVLLPSWFVLHRMLLLLVALKMSCYWCNALTIDRWLVV